MTKAQYEQIKRDAHHLALDIGVRPAARAMGLSEARLMKWSSRQKWNIGMIRPQAISNGTNGLDLPPSAGVSTDTIEVKSRIIQHYSERAKIGAVIAGSKVFEHLADKDPRALIAPATAIAADQWGKVTDRAAGWSAARAQGVQVAVQVNLPTQAQDDARMATDDRLDEIARLLRDAPRKA